MSALKTITFCHRNNNPQLELERKPIILNTQSRISIGSDRNQLSPKLTMQLQFTTSAALLLLPILPYLVTAAVDGPCTGKTGVCVSKSACAKKSGTSSKGFCPFDGNGILCCSKDNCLGVGSSCKFTKNCKGNHFSVAGHCPGPKSFQCCTSGCPICGREENGLEKRCCTE